MSDNKGSPSSLPQSPAALPFCDVLPLLRKMAPALWAKASAAGTTPHARRERFLDLLAWLFSKNGIQIVRPARQDYSLGGKLVEGRLDMVATQAGQRIALEFVVRPSASDALKLIAAQRSGATSILLCAFASDIRFVELTYGKLLCREVRGGFHIIPVVAVPLKPK